jgi:hypothetical protein
MAQCASIGLCVKVAKLEGKGESLGQRHSMPCFRLVDPVQCSHLSVSVQPSVTAWILFHGNETYRSRQKVAGYVLALIDLLT